TTCYVICTQVELRTVVLYEFFFSSRRRHTRSKRDWSSDVCSSDLYVTDFGTQPGDHCLVAEVERKVIGTAWCRIMEDYGHIDNDTPSLAISLLPEYRGQGTGTQLLNALLLLLRENGYQRASLSVQKENPALRLYQRAGFRILAEKGTEYLMLWDGTQ